MNDNERKHANMAAYIEEPIIRKLSVNLLGVLLAAYPAKHL